MNVRLTAAFLLCGASMSFAGSEPDFSGWMSVRGTSHFDYRWAYTPVGPADNASATCTYEIRDLSGTDDNRHKYTITYRDAGEEKTTWGTLLFPRYQSNRTKRDKILYCTGITRVEMDE